MPTLSQWNNASWTNEADQDDLPTLTAIYDAPSDEDDEDDMSDPATLEGDTPSGTSSPSATGATT